MLTRFFIYGALGWVVEIVWTGLGSILRRDPKLRATTYLWMFPIYGGAAILFERVFIFIAPQPWILRGLVWVAAIFAVEYVTGFLIKQWVGESPWDYSGTRFSVQGLIRLDYAPAWFVLGLLFEHMHQVLIGIVP